MHSWRWCYNKQLLLNIPSSRNVKCMLLYFRKYIQVTVIGLCETEFTLSEWSLQPGNNKDIDLVCLNKPGQTMVAMLVLFTHWFYLGHVRMFMNLCVIWKVKELIVMENIEHVLLCLLCNASFCPSACKYSFFIHNEHRLKLPQTTLLIPDSSVFVLTDLHLLHHV